MMGQIQKTVANNILKHLQDEGLILLQGTADKIQAWDLAIRLVECIYENIQMARMVIFVGGKATRLWRIFLPINGDNNRCRPKTLLNS